MRAASAASLGQLGEVRATAPLLESLKDAKLAEQYLRAAPEDEDPRVFLQALRNV